MSMFEECLKNTYFNVSALIVTFFVTRIIPASDPSGFMSSSMNTKGMYLIMYIGVIIMVAAAFNKEKSRLTYACAGVGLGLCFPIVGNMLFSGMFIALLANAAIVVIMIVAANIVEYKMDEIAYIERPDDFY